MVDTLHSEGTIPHLIIRSDAGTKMGSGHLMRCLALGQAWKDRGGEVQFVTACTNKELLQCLHRENFIVHRLGHLSPAVEDWRFTQHLLTRQPDAWLVLDGYHFGSDYQKQVKRAGYRLMVIDDMNGLPHYYADIVLNQNIYANNLRYSCEPHTTLLLGSKYALLRREFLKWRGWKRTISTVARKVLVTLGGGDPDNVTLKVICALQQVEIEGLQATVLVGSSSLHNQELKSAAESSRVPICLASTNLTMPELMAWADVAVAAGGATSWELALLGTPRLALILADNQAFVAERLGASGAAKNLGWHDSVSSDQIAQTLTQLLQAPDMRAEMCRRAQSLVDGDGAERVLMHLRGRALRIRPVEESDCRLLWEWASEPEVRAFSLSPEKIPWESHRKWFMSKMRDANCFIFIGVDAKDEPVGQVRFDVNQDREAEVDITIGRSRRGHGYGTLLLDMATEQLLRISPVRAVHAFIRPSNNASARAFEKAAFERVGEETVKANKVLHYARVERNGK
jgi:UDP-2,4-diacetamido-2,4,6-trideoxy-beta-L-altropyranose hydrolase